MRRDGRLAPTLAAAALLVAAAAPSAGWAITGASVTAPTLSVDGACTAASISSFSFTYSATGATDDGGARDYFTVYLLDGASTVLHVGTTFAGSGGGLATNTLAYATNVTPTTQTLRLIIADETDATEDYVVGATFAGVAATTTSFDSHALDPDCPLDASPAADPADTETSTIAASAENLAASRASTVVARLPQLATRLSASSAPKGGFNGSGASRQGVSTFDLGVGGVESGGLEIGAWVSGYYSYVIDDAGSVEFETHLGVAQAGVDVKLTDRLLIGLMLQGDLSRQYVSGTAGGDSIGFLAGPYAVCEPVENVYLETLAALGRADNEVTDASGAKGDYGSDRLLLSAKISGAWELDAWTITPSASLAYYAERAEAFTDSGGTRVEETTQSLTQARIGPDLAYRFELEDMTITPSVGLRGVYSATRSGGSTVSSGGSGADGFSLSLNSGVDLSWETASLGVAAMVDGVGDGEQTAYTGMATLRIAF